MERIIFEDSNWPDPSGSDYKALARRLAYAHDSLEEEDFYNAAEVMHAFEYITLHPTLKDVQVLVSNIRKQIKSRYTSWR